LLGVVGPFLFSLLTTTTRLFDNKRKKSHEPSWPDNFSRIPTNVPPGPVGYRVELTISPEGEQNRSYQDLAVD